MKMKIKEWVLGIRSWIRNRYDRVTSSFFRALRAIGIEEDLAKLIVYIILLTVGVSVDPFFLYIPFLSHTKMCLGMNTELWKVAVALRTIVDFFTSLISFMSIDRSQLSRFISILWMCWICLAVAPIPQIFFSENLILKTLGGYTLWNLFLFFLYGARFVRIFLACEKLKEMVSDEALRWFNAPLYLFLFLIKSHVIGACWYHLSIKRLLSCWNYACKNTTGCVFSCDGTTPSTLNSTLVIKFCPLNDQKFGIFLDALESGIVEDKVVQTKFLRCLSWALKNLSSFASNLHTTTDDGETVFAIIISTFGLIASIYLLENIRVGVFRESRSANSATESDSATESV